MASEASTSQQYDLTQKLLPHLDRQLGLALVDFLDEQNVYSHQDLLKAKLDLLQSTNMVTYIAQLDAELHGGKGSEQVQKDCKDREGKIEDALNTLESQAGKVMDIITVPEVFQALKQDKQQNLQFLKQQHNLTLEEINVLYKLGRFQFTVGQYGPASDFLYHFRVLTTDPDLEASAMWGKLVADTLDGSWDAALNELELVRKHIDSQFPTTNVSNLTATQGLQQRTWWLHWSLFVYFNQTEGRAKLVDAWMSQTAIPAIGRENREQQAYIPTFLPTIQANAPWLLRYLIAAVVLSKKANFKGGVHVGPTTRLGSKELVGAAILNALKQEAHEFSDPLTEFLRALLVELDFEKASEKLVQCEEVFKVDFFLAPFKEEWSAAARWLYSEAYCRIHNEIDISALSTQLGLSAEEGERWIVSLIRDARLDAKIDLKENVVTMNRSTLTPAQMLIDKTKSILERSARIDLSDGAEQQKPQRRGGGGQSGQQQQQQQGQNGSR